MPIVIAIRPKPIFTFHYVSINSILVKRHFLLHLNLHSTMYLLILSVSCCVRFGHNLFTFHYVSINSPASSLPADYQSNLHSTMYLLIQYSLRVIPYTFLYLHSTMYLLILCPPIILLRCFCIYIPLCIY